MVTEDYVISAEIVPNVAKDDVLVLQMEENSLKLNNIYLQGEWNHEIWMGKGAREVLALFTVNLNRRVNPNLETANIGSCVSGRPFKYGMVLGKNENVRQCFLRMGSEHGQDTAVEYEITKGHATKHGTPTKGTDLREDRRNDGETKRRTDL